MFNGQAMAIPSRDEVHVVSGHDARTNDQVLQGLIEKVTHVNRPVRIRGAVVQDVGPPGMIQITHTAIQVHPFPAGLQPGLELKQVSLHREACTR